MRNHGDEFLLRTEVPIGYGNRSALVSIEDIGFAVVMHPEPSGSRYLLRIARLGMNG